MTASPDDMYDEMLREEFRTGGLPMEGGDAGIHVGLDTQAPPEDVEEAPADGEGPRGPARYRNAAMVGAGGLACAEVGAFLGGLGGSFSTAPAAAHPMASSTTTNQSPTGSANAADDGNATTSLSGSLTQNAVPMQWLTAQSGCTTTTTDLGLGCVLVNLTTAPGSSTLCRAIPPNSSAVSFPRSPVCSPT